MTKRSYDGEELGPAARPRPALNVNMGGLRGDLYATPRSPAKTDSEDILSKGILPADCVKMIAISAPSTSHLFVSESTGFVYKAPFPASTYEPMLNHEFAILAALSRPPHPNIVLLAPSGYQDTKEPRRYFAMERLTQDLAKYLASAPRPSAEFVWGVLRDVARGLRRIHSLNIVHGDIRLMNLLLDKDNRVKIADFGTAAKPGDSLRGVSKNWWILLAGDASFTPELDMFCLGLAALQLLTGGASDIRKSLGDDDVRYIPENLEPLLKSQQDAKLANAIRRLLKKDPKERLTPEGLLELAGPATNEK